jgi:hypothetical protein
MEPGLPDSKNIIILQKVRMHEKDNDYHCTRRNSRNAGRDELKVDSFFVYTQGNRYYMEVI